MNFETSQAATILGIIKGMSRKYRHGDAERKLEKVFNHGCDRVAAVQVLPKTRQVLLNGVALSSRERKRVGRLLNLFKGWEAVTVYLGYPEWYFIRDLESCLHK